jgi:O-antigen/teichoic acid export membrane protein
VATGVVVVGIGVTSVMGLVLCVLLFGAADLLSMHVFHKPSLAPILRILALSVPSMAVADLLVFAMRGLKRLECEAIISQIIVPLLKVSGLIVVVCLVENRAIGMAYALLASTIVGALLALIVMWRLYPLRGSPGSPILTTSVLLAFSWPLLLNQFINRAIKEVETLFLGVWVSSDQVGVYYVGLKTTVLIRVFLTAFSTIFAPMMAELHGRQEHKLFGSLLKTVTKWGFSLCFPIFLVLFFFSRQVLLVFGPGFAAGAVVLQILALSELVNVAAGPVGWALTMTGYPHLNLINAVVLLVTDAALALLLIPRYGILGAAISEATVLFLINLLRLVEVYVLLRIHPYNLSYWKPIGAGLLSAAVLLGLLKLVSGLPAIGQVFLAILASLLAYTAGLLILGLDDDDRWVLGALRRRLTHLVSRKTMNR